MRPLRAGQNKMQVHLVMGVNFFVLASDAHAVLYSPSCLSSCPGSDG